jgi:hypothetical protein
MRTKEAAIHSQAPEIRRIMVPSSHRLQASPRQIVREILSQKNSSQKGSKSACLSNLRLPLPQKKLPSTSPLKEKVPLSKSVAILMMQLKSYHSVFQLQLMTGGTLSPVELTHNGPVT